jgi:hypothetical protein
MSFLNHYAQLLTVGLERSGAVQAICIPLNFLMFSVVILRTCFPTKGSLAFRVILVHFAAKTHQHQLPLSVGHVPRLCKNSNDQINHAMLRKMCI